MKILMVLGGNPPEESLFREALSGCDLHLAVDGGAEVFYRFDAQPDLILGDMDSFQPEPENQVPIIHLPDQNLTDLQKALDYTLKHYEVFEILLLGAAGGRNDHLISNLHICAALPESIKISWLNSLPASTQFKQECITRVCSEHVADLEVGIGDTVSIFSVTAFQALRSKGLKWEIRGLNSKEMPFSQSNLATGNKLTITLDNGVVYVAVYQ